MARCSSLVIPAGGMSHVFNIGASVGKNSVNNREDVFLIQYLLAAWFATEKDTAKLLPFILADPTPMKIDGICSVQTIARIDIFDKFHQGSVTADGRFDPIFQTVAANKLFLLNQLFFFAGGLKGKIEVVAGISFPEEIRKLLYL
jgi:hypothetical protein